MNRVKLILGSILVFAILLAGAVAWDSVREVSESLAELKEQDKFLIEQENRYISGAERLGKNAQWEAALKEYRDSSSRSERLKRFEALTQAVENSAARDIDLANPLIRRSADEMAGARNRRELALKEYGEALKTYQSASNSYKGKIAKYFVEVPTE